MSGLAHADLDVDLVSRNLAGRIIGCRVLHYETLGSTMDEARSLAERGEPDGTVVVVEEQTAGRGRFDRAWVSPRGQNLSFSVVLRPTAAQLPYVNMAATLAIARCVSEITHQETGIKWPNDVRIDGLKISGILIETAMAGMELDHAVVGIGLNVNFDPAEHPEIASTATSLYRETGETQDRGEVLGRVLAELDDLYRAVRSGKSLTNDWAAMLETLGRTVQVRWKERVIEGRADAVDDQGNLILVGAGGVTTTVTAGEVTLQV